MECQIVSGGLIVLNIGDGVVLGLGFILLHVDWCL